MKSEDKHSREKMKEHEKLAENPAGMNEQGGNFVDAVKMEKGEYAGLYGHKE
jgi:hypothetical protein